MKIGITPIIAENIAPPDASSLAIFNGAVKVCDIDISKMQPSNLGNKQYSFGLVSDLHITASTSVAWQPTVKFDNALTYFENQGCAFCVVCGDLTQTGFYRRTNESDASTTYLDETQFANYKGICDKHTVPVYALMGNHESIYGIPISNDLDLVETYTGKGALSYVLEQANDLLILLGQPNYNKVMSDEDFEWFKNLLVSNQDKRCFVFVHSYIEEDSGDARDFRENSVFEDWGVTKTDEFKNLIKQYPNVILFHGHSHIKFECQSLDKSANYTDKNGFKSIHVPSLSRPRDIIDNASVDDLLGSQGYIVDVYESCIVLNGIDFTDENKQISIAQYCIETTLRTIEANTYTDSTGTIIT